MAGDLRGEILAAAALIASEWRGLAVAWHAVVAVLGVTWWRSRRVDGPATMTILSLMPFSVATMAAWSSNPFNITVFVAVGLVMLGLAGTAPPARVRLASGRDAAAGGAMCVFGWVYPHFLDAPAWHYLYASPLGLLPCPTLAFLIGVSLLTDSFGSKPWAILLGLVGLAYGLIGVLALHVTIDWLLIAGAAALLVRAAVPLRLPDLFFNREKRHV